MFRRIKTLSKFGTQLGYQVIKYKMKDESNGTRSLRLKGNMSAGSLNQLDAAVSVKLLSAFHIT